jgi:hypothetical protein
MSIKSGFSDNTKLYIEGNETELSGNLRMRYKNLKVSILKSKKESLRKRGFSSYIANTVIPTNNPRKGSLFLKEGSVYLKHDTIQMFVPYVMFGFLEGVKSTLGFRSKEVKKYDKLNKILERAKRRKAKVHEKQKTSTNGPLQKPSNDKYFDENVFIAEIKEDKNLNKLYREWL